MKIIVCDTCNNSLDESDTIDGRCKTHINTGKGRLYLVSELIEDIYQDNLNHFEFHENMGGEDCDCHIHTTIKTIVEYWEK